MLQNVDLTPTTYFVQNLTYSIVITDPLQQRRSENFHTGLPLPKLHTMKSVKPHDSDVAPRQDAQQWHNNSHQ